MEQQYIRRFRKIFVVEPSHDVSILSRYSDQIVFLSTVEDKLNDLPDKISKMLSDFDPDNDAVIPMGRVSSCLIAGISIASKILSEIPLGENRLIVIGFYSVSDYIFIEMRI